MHSIGHSLKAVSGHGCKECSFLSSSDITLGLPPALKVAVEFYPVAFFCYVMASVLATWLSLKLTKTGSFRV